MNSDNFTVTAWTNGSYAYGLRVKKQDRESFFKQSWTSVSLRLVGGIQPTTAHTT